MDPVAAFGTCRTCGRDIEWHGDRYNGIWFHVGRFTGDDASDVLTHTAVPAPPLADTLRMLSY